MRPSLILVATLLLTGVPPARAQSEDALPPSELTRVRAALVPVVGALDSGDLQAVERLALDAYLAFEDIEPRVAALDPELVDELEAAYGEIRGRAAAGDSAGARGAVAEVHELLASSAASPTLGPRMTFLHSFGILFREGIEALLLCSVLAAACARRGAGRLTRAIIHGAVAAIAASVLTAFFFVSVVRLAPAGREAIEGITMLLAAAVLFYVSYWLLSKIEVARWMAFLRQQVGQAESRWALMGVAFLAVYREGVETVLFYQALAAVGAPVPIALGFCAAVLLLAGVAIAVFRFGVRLPARPLFTVTGGLLYYLAIVFTGQGIHELQEAGWIGLTPVAGAPRVAWLGLHPSAETLGAQGLLVALALIAAIVLVRRVKDSATSVARPAPLH